MASGVSMGKRTYIERQKRGNQFRIPSKPPSKKDGKGHVHMIIASKDIKSHGKNKYGKFIVKKNDEQIHMPGVEYFDQLRNTLKNTNVRLDSGEEKPLLVVAKVLTLDWKAQKEAQREIQSFYEFGPLRVSMFDDEDM